MHVRMVILPLLCLLLVLECRAQLDIPESPCPDVFQYVQDQLGNWKGLLRIPPPRGAAPLHIRIELYLQAALPTVREREWTQWGYKEEFKKYAGRLGLAEDKDLVSQRILAGSRERVKYDLLFPLTYPLPHINRIIANNDLLCDGPLVSSRVLTRITLEHSLFPIVSPLNSGPVNNGLDGFNFNPGPQNGFNFKPDPPFFNPDQNFSFFENPSRPKPKPQPQPQEPPPPPPVQRPKPTKPQPPTTTPVTIVNREPDRPKPGLSTKDICGQSIIANELVLNGRQTKRGEWPWIAAIFSSTQIGQEFLCSGVLINTRHVLTAGHCIRLRDQPEIKASQLVVYLGKYQLLHFAESNTQLREVERISLHPEYGVSRSLDADLAILQLSLSVEITRYILPVCMWTQSTDLEPIVGKLGTVVGWGRDEKGNKATNEPRLAEIPIVSQSECLFSNPDFYNITSERTFCAGFRNDSGPCNGDSGSGLVIPMKEHSRIRWYLRGLVSVSLLNRDTGLCDLKNYVVFTDVAKFQSWLQQFQEFEELKFRGPF